MIFNPLFILILNLLPFLFFLFYRPLILDFKIFPEAELKITWVVLVIFLSIIITYVFFKNQNLKINASSNNIVKQLFKITRVLLIISTLLLLFIVFSGALSFQGNFYSSKDKLGDFNGVRILIHLKNVLIPLSLSRVISSYLLSYEGLPNQLVFSLKRVSIFWNFSFKNYPTISWLIVISIFLSGFYSFYFGERMTFYETLVSVILPLNLYGIIRLSVKQIFFVSMAFVLSFMAFEFSRNFYIQYIERGQANIDWDFFVFAFQYTLDKFFLYYMDCVNKFVFVISNDLGGTGGQLKILIEPLASLGIVDTSYFQINQYLSSEYFTDMLTNYGAATVLYLDFGWLGILFIVIAFMILCFLFKACLRGVFEFVPYYNLLILSFLELPRIPYWYFSRFTIPLFFYISFLFFTTSIRRAYPRSKYY
jgi:hypothetical protein